MKDFNEGGEKHLITADFSSWGTNPEAGRPVELFSVEEQKDRLVLAHDNLIESTRNTMVDSVGWLPAFAEQYNISASIKDYVLVPVTIMPSDIPNKNAQGFPLEELVRASVETGQIAYETFARKPTFVDHCFTADTTITTQKGYKTIDKIKLGDKVLTHDRQFKKVTKLFKHDNKSISEIKCDGLVSTIKTTENHPMWVIDARQLYDTSTTEISKFKLKGNKYDIQWEELKPHFRPVSDIYLGDYLCVPINMGGEVTVNKDYAFITGIHMAEGCYEWYKNKPVAVKLTIGKNETELRNEIFKRLDNLGYKYSHGFHKKINLCWIRIASKELAEELYGLTGNLAHKKRMSSELKKWDKESIKNFLGGYISGDGCISRWGGTNKKTGIRSLNTKLRCRTSSKQLANDIWHALGYVGVAASVVHDGKPTTYKYYCNTYNVIRTMNGKGSYTVGAIDFEAYKLNEYIIAKPQMSNRNRKLTQQKVLLKGNYFLVPVTSITREVSKETVYNFEVMDVHTYVANSVAVHNCNNDHTKAKGVILSSIMKPMFGAKGNLWKVICLCAFDRKTHPAISNKILTGEYDNYSMGAMASFFTCSACGEHHTSKHEGCGHVSVKRPGFKLLPNDKLAYLQARYPVGFETSLITSKPANGRGGGAYYTAVTDPNRHLRFE